MSRRRKRTTTAANDSFDLFLDTITNTFGGILLIAILVVLLVRQVDQNDHERTPDQTATAGRLEEQLNLRRAELKTIEQALTLQSHITGSTAQQPDAQTLSKLLELEQQQSELEKELIDRQNELKDIQRERSASKSTLNQVDAKISAMKKMIEQQTTLLDEEKKLRTRTMTLPKEKSTFKRLTVVVIKNDHGYILDKTRGGLSFELNKEHFEKCTEAEADVVLMSGVAVKAKPNAGLAISTTDWNSVLRSFDPNCYITFVVNPDSFDTFRVVREACVRANREYQILPNEQGPVYETRSTGPAKAQ